MKKILLVSGVAMSLCAIALVLHKGAPRDEVSLNAVADWMESLLGHADKTAKVLVEVSVEEEMLMGDSIHEEIMTRRAAVALADSPLARYVTEVGQRVAANVKRKEIVYKFHLLDSQAVNAKAVPGGHIYITLGLLSALNSEAELAAILGHEITHVDAGHAVNAFKHRFSAGGNKVLTGDIYGGLGYSLFLRAGFSEYEEAEADRTGVYLAALAGYHPEAIEHAFRNVFGATAEANKAAGLNPVGDTFIAAGGFIARYFSTHPETEERVEKIARYIREAHLYDPGKKYYIGLQNRQLLESRSQKERPEEWSSSYPDVPKPEADADGSDLKRPEPEYVEELYTEYGHLRVGMGLQELKKMLPEKQIAFDHDGRMGFKNVWIYRVRLDGSKARCGLWFEFENDKVARIRIIR